MKTNTPIRIGIVGAGDISDFHARGILESPHANMTAIADFDNNKRNEFADRYLHHVKNCLKQILSML